MAGQEQNVNGQQAAPALPRLPVLAPRPVIRKSLLAPRPVIRKSLLAAFKPNLTTMTGIASVRAKVLGAKNTYSFYVPDNDQLNGGLAFAVALNEAAGTADNRLLCTNVAAMISIVMPSVRDAALEALGQIGVNPELVSLPSRAAEHFLDVTAAPELVWSDILVNAGCCLLILFKTINPANYTQYIARRITALKSKAGSDPGQKFPIPFSLAQATAIGGMLGANLGLKRKLINEIVNLSDGSDNLSQTVQYISLFLSFNEMKAFQLVYETLLVTQSVVLEDPRIASELRNVKDAINAMRSTTHPQFARYIVDTPKLYLFERSRFPTLAAVAQLIKTDVHASGTVKQFIATARTQSALVADLYNMHVDTMVGHHTSGGRAPRNYLVTDFDESL
ncbi:hypothetical protein M6B38_296365 [Iris pallida]|uniref:Nucleoprotein n=1 Tax=Iris pallida TaxID=29817 RepID=A0AAX6HQN9_IRIPA|nr:hypothetical protein M6B38_296365 [Iris pallida]